MSENVSLDEEILTDKNSGEIAGEDVASRDCTNQMEKNSTSIESEAPELNTNEVVSGYNNVERNEEALENDIGDSHFESRVASLSLNSDCTEKSYVTADGEKVEDNSPASASCKTDAVAAAENFEEEQIGIPAPEENPFLQSVKYLEKHQILRLFQNFAAQIVYNRPDNPLQYLVDELERSSEEALQVAKESKEPVTPSPDLFS
ncbi:uncharacterized protein LOC110063658 [Orbicella faveolata]|uniref:uncharacterized protein LOC110063658 n=1 Tax=Orbicella faveolata TaxID=48498 RepID=UPI0009E47C2F|nr:uncharacterized protein LOC110063658 [Orbicella faveolata]